jgi:hypothetical protein
MSCILFWLFCRFTACKKGQKEHIFTYIQEGLIVKRSFIRTNCETFGKHYFRRI